MKDEPRFVARTHGFVEDGEDGEETRFAEFCGTTRSRHTVLFANRVIII